MVKRRVLDQPLAPGYDSVDDQQRDITSHCHEPSSPTVRSPPSSHSKGGTLVPRLGTDNYPIRGRQNGTRCAGVDPAGRRRPGGA
jgi:hypothetical protein